MSVIAAAVDAPSRRLDEIDDRTAVAIEDAPAAWAEYVQRQPAATGYHDWAWRDIIAGTFGHEPLYFAARRAGRVVGVLPTVVFESVLFGRAMISLPFVNYGGVIADDPLAERALFERAVDAARERRCRHVELRHFRQHFSETRSKHHKVTMVLPLRTPAVMWDALDRKVRNQVRKAQKSGLTYQRGGSELLPAFYEVFARNMRDLGTPVHGAAFFSAVLRAFGGRTSVHAVFLGERPVAAGLTFQTRTTLEIPWASSVRDFNTLCPNHLLYWNVLEGAASGGCSAFDFGRSTPNEGTYRFKEQWGAEPVPLCWEYHLIKGGELPNASPTNAKFRLAISLWQRLPVAIATWLGPAIARSLP